MILVIRALFYKEVTFETEQKHLSLFIVMGETQWSLIFVKIYFKDWVSKREKISSICWFTPKCPQQLELSPAKAKSQLPSQAP